MPSDYQRRELARLLASAKVPLFVYTRADAIADGSLYPVPEEDLEETGFVLPMCLSASVYVAADCEDSFALLRVLRQTFAAVAARSVQLGEDRVYFDLLLPTGGLLPVVLHCGPGDSPDERVLTLCEPAEL